MGLDESMESEVCWSDLPGDLVAKIADQTPTDIIVFRSICRSWRLSLPPPLPNKHILFPLTISFDDQIPTPVSANAVYLVSHRRDDSKVWMFSVQEYNPGKFLVQHPITYQTIPGSFVIDLSVWRVTQIYTSYTYKDDTLDDMSTKIQRNVILVPNSTTPTAICRYRQPLRSLWSFRTTTEKEEEEEEEEEEDNISYATQLSPFVNREIYDFVSFNGWIYLVEALDINEEGEARSYDILMFDYKTSQQFGIVCDNLAPCLTMGMPLNPRFIVSNGDLYIVIECIWYDIDKKYECCVYRLVRDDMNVPTCCKWERVVDLGDMVFFMGKNGSFSVPARNLPRPWEGNLVVRIDSDIDTDVMVFDLGTNQRKHVVQLLPEGYVDLFYSLRLDRPRKYVLGLANSGDPAPCTTNMGHDSDKGKGVVDNTVESTASDGIDYQEEGSTSSTTFISSSQKDDEELKS